MSGREGAKGIVFMKHERSNKYEFQFFSLLLLLLVIPPRN
jgi:hypothetical protein